MLTTAGGSGTAVIAAVFADCCASANTADFCWCWAITAAVEEEMSACGGTMLPPPPPLIRVTGVVVDCGGWRIMDPGTAATEDN